MASTGFRLELNKPGIRALLQSAEVKADLEGRARRMAEAAGGAEDFEVVVSRNSDRAVAFVRTASMDARRAEAEDRALLRSLDAGR